MQKLIKTGNLRFYAIALMLATFLSSTLAIAQEFVARSDRKTVAVGEAFQISYSLNTGGRNFVGPDLSNFHVLSGPNQSSSMQFINGAMSQSISFSYVLSPKKEGTYVIPPASVVVNGSTINSNSLEVVVGKGSSSGNYAQQHANTNNNNNSQQNNGDKLFVKTTVTNTSPYQGEQITVIHKVYTKLNLRGFQDVVFPSYNGFWSHDVAQPAQVELQRENIDGVYYYVAELKRSFLFPQRSGELVIPPVEVECVVRERTNNRPQSIFDQFFGGGGYRDALVRAKGTPIKIKVKPLPEKGKPKNFNGAVGNYTYNVELDNNKVKANDAINLNIKITGSGNLKLLNQPNIEFPQEFETYDPKINEQIASGKGGVNGSKSFEYLIIPRAPGKYDLGDISFSFFSPSKGRYITLPSPELIITVEEGDQNSNAQPIVGKRAKERVKAFGNDIRYIHVGDNELRANDQYTFGSGLFYGGLFSPLVLLASLLLIRRKRRLENEDQIGTRRKRANKVAIKRLAIAEKHLTNNESEQFFEETLNALLGYFSDKYNIPTSELSKEKIESVLNDQGKELELINSLKETIEKCETARYAPLAIEGDLQSTYNKSVELISKLERES